MNRRRNKKPNQDNVRKGNRHYEKKGKEEITIKETMIAMEVMGKNKASSVDELMDIIFQEKEWQNMKKRLEGKKLVRRDWRRDNFWNNKKKGEDMEGLKLSEKVWINHVKYRLAKNLT